MTQDFARAKCAEPEETIKGKVLDIIVTALASFPESSAVSVSASGSQGITTGDKAMNHVTLEIKPLHGFIE